MQEQVSQELEAPRRGRKYTEKHVKAIDESFRALAREDFWTYRKLITDGFIDSWWQRDVAKHIQQFWYDYLAGKRPKLILQAPPQHGKSEQMRDAVTWIAGQNRTSRPSSRATACGTATLKRVAAPRWVLDAEDDRAATVQARAADGPHQLALQPEVLLGLPRRLSGAVAVFDDGAPGALATGPRTAKG